MDTPPPLTNSNDNPDEPAWHPDAAIIETTTYRTRHDAGVAVAHLQIKLLDDDVVFTSLEQEPDRIILYYTFALDIGFLDKITARFETIEEL